MAELTTGDLTTGDLTTMDLIIVAPRPAARIRRRAKAAEHRAAGQVRHPRRVSRGQTMTEARAGAGGGGAAAPAR